MSRTTYILLVLYIWGGVYVIMTEECHQEGALGDDAPATSGSVDDLLSRARSGEPGAWEAIVRDARSKW